MKKLNNTVMLLIIIFLFPSFALAGNATVTCKFEDISTFYFDNGKIEAELDKETKVNQVIFSGLDTETPVMKGNMGESPLGVLKQDAEAIWLVEVTDIGNINIWTIFKKQNIAIQAKQYSIFGKPFGLMSMGKCH